MANTKTAADKTRRDQDARRKAETTRRSKKLRPIPDTTTKSYWDTISRWPARFED